LNVTQAVCALFLEPKYILQTWAGLLVGQLWILAWDHFKVLRVVRAFNFSSFHDERVSQRLTSVPCGIIAACVLYRFRRCRRLEENPHGDTDPHGDTEGEGDFLFCAVVFFVHIVVHILLLKTVSSRCGIGYQRSREEIWERKPSYKDIARTLPANYFNTNPVHCLRSRYLHRQEPPCQFYINGKEHLLQVNHDIGQYYEVKEWDDKRKTFCLEMSFCVQKVRKTVTRDKAGTVTRDPPGGAGQPHGNIVKGGRLWKANKQVAEEMMLEYVASDCDSDDSGQPSRASSGNTGNSWNSLNGWRMRLFMLRCEERGRLAHLVYCSEKADEECLACALASMDPTLSVMQLPCVQLDRLDENADRELRLSLLSYEVAFSDDPLKRAFISSEPLPELPTAFYPMAILWTDEKGQDKHLIVAHERQDGLEEWLDQMRSMGCES